MHRSLDFVQGRRIGRVRRAKPSEKAQHLINIMTNKQPSQEEELPHHINAFDCTFGVDKKPQKKKINFKLKRPPQSKSQEKSSKSSSLAYKNHQRLNNWLFLPKMEMTTDMTEQKRGRLRRMKFSSFSEDEYTHSVLDKPKKRLKECYEDFYYEGEENLKKTIGKRFRKTTFDACSDEEEDLEEDSGRRLSAISNISRSFIQERNFEIIERVFPSKKRRNNASFGSQDGKKSGFLGIVKDKIFQKINKLRRGTSESSHSSENNYVKQMRAILRRSQKHGSMTEKEKEQMAKLIFQNCGFPKAYRTKLWTLASGGERQRRNNIGYYTLKPYIEDEQKSSDENPEFKERRDSISDEDI